MAMLTAEMLQFVLFTSERRVLISVGKSVCECNIMKKISVHVGEKKKVFSQQCFRNFRKALNLAGKGCHSDLGEFLGGCLPLLL